MPTTFRTTVLGLAGLTLLFAVCRTCHAQAPPFDWVREGGGTDNDMAYQVAVDSIGNLYVSGSFFATATFGGVTLNNPGGANGSPGSAFFLLKYDSAGSLAWARSSTGDGGGPKVSGGLTTDVGGNIYAAGTFPGAGYINFGAFALSTSGSDAQTEVFVVKYGPTGNVFWARQGAQGGGANAFNGANALATSLDGGVYVAGYFANSVTFGSTTLTSAGASDAFLTMYDANGNLRWARKAGGTGQDYAHFVTTDAAGNAVIAGYCTAPGNFSGIVLTNGGLFLATYDTNGDIISARNLSGGGGSTSLHGAADPAGNLFLTGFVLSGNADRLTKYDASGNLLWNRNLGGPANSVACDSAGNAYVTGSFTGTASFGSSNLVSSGSNDVFITKINGAGNVIWAKSAGFIYGDIGRSIAVDPLGNLYVAGDFYDTSKFDGTNVFGNGQEDAFVTRLPAVAPLPPTISNNPTNQNVAPGATATFAVAANGTPPLNYHWQFFGTNLTLETNAILVITNAQSMREGPYRVVVSNAAAALTSAVATLTLVLPPAIATQPVSQILLGGADANFMILASGTLPLFYRWRFNGADLPTGTNATLTVTNAQPPNGGSYTVVVTNAYGAVTSSVATLTIRYSLTVNVTGGGTVARNPFFTNYPPNFTVTLTAIPTAGFFFNAWSGDASGSANPLSLNVTSNKTITANFASTALTIESEGEGSVSRSPDRASYSLGDEVTLSATPGRWFAFTRWGDGLTINPRLITIGASNNYTAIFSATTSVETLTFSNVSRIAPSGMPAIFVDGQFVLTGQVSRLGSAEVSMLTTYPNGAIFYTLNGTTPDFGAELYDGSFIIRRSGAIRAVAYDASFLNSWEADPINVIIEPTYFVNASTPGGGAVNVSPLGSSFPSNTLVTLTAVPQPGWHLLQWLGDAVGTDATTTVRVQNRDLCAKAIFGTPLLTTVAGNGVLVLEPIAPLLPYGTTVRLTGIPQSGNYFAAWGNAVVSTTNPLMYSVTSATQTISSAFGALSDGQVALTVLVVGRGRVVTAPPGNRFTANQHITLTAMPDPDQDFVGWTGDGSGASTNVSLVLPQSKIVTATFTTRPRLSVGPCTGGSSEEGFQLTLIGEIGGRYQIEQSSGLTDWNPVGTFTNSFGVLRVTDLTTNEVQRIYRALATP